MLRLLLLPCVSIHRIHSCALREGWWWLALLSQRHGGIIQVLRACMSCHYELPLSNLESYTEAQKYFGRIWCFPSFSARNKNACLVIHFSSNQINIKQQKTRLTKKKSFKRAVGVISNDTYLSSFFFPNWQVYGNLDLPK